MTVAELTQEHMGLVRLAAHRAAGKGIPFEEAMQDGAIGLMSAIKRWDESRGLVFSTFAFPRIAGAITDGARARDSRPRSYRRRKTEIARSRERLRKMLEREPTAYEVAAEMEVSVEWMWEWSTRVSEPSHMDAPMSEDGELLRDMIVGSDGRDESDELERMLVVKARMSRLTRQELQVLALYFYDKLKLREIARVFGVTESRICQIRTKALGKLKGRRAA